MTMVPLLLSKQSVPSLATEYSESGFSFLGQVRYKAKERIQMLMGGQLPSNTPFSFASECFSVYRSS